jgi:hypothetical protein
VSRAAAAAIAVVSALAGCRGAAAPRDRAVDTVRTATVGRGKVVDRVLLTGEIDAASAVDLTVPTTEVWELPIRWMAEDGMTVNAGQRVLEFDNSAFTKNLDEKRLAAREAAMTYNTLVALNTVTLADKEAELKQHEIALAKATLLASVPADLLPARTAQERQLDKKRAEVAVETATRELASVREASALEARVKKIELDKTVRAIESLEHAISELVLSAPRDGTIVIGEHPWEGRKYKIGDTVQPGWAIVRLPELGRPMEVRTELSDVDDGRISIGMTGSCTLDAYPADPVPCTVKAITAVARSKNQSSLRRAFAVVMTLARTDPERMRPGMSVKVELGPPPLADVVVAPRGAIVIDGKTTRLRLAGGGSRDVTLGPCDAQGCVVASGASAGDQVSIGGDR